MKAQIELLCNLCGLSCCLNKEPHGLINQTIQGGYESTPGTGPGESGTLDDLTNYTFFLCEFWLDWLFNQFQIPVIGKDSDGHTEVYRSAEERVLTDDWRRFKEEFFAEFRKRNAYRNGLI